MQIQVFRFHVSDRGGGVPKISIPIIFDSPVSSFKTAYRLESSDSFLSQKNHQLVSG